jgi:AraC-like DNA-binding protein
VPIRRLELPSASVMLIICFDGNVEIADPGRHSRADLTAFAVGFASGAVVTRHVGQLGCVEVDLSPVTAGMLLNETPALAGAGIANLADLWGSDVSILIDRLRGVSNWAARFAIVDEALLGRLRAARCTVPPEVMWAWKRIVSSAGQIDIGALARAVGWSSRHFATRFRDAVGENPKAAAHRLRLSHAQALLASRVDHSLCDIALTCGYSDQSHLTREFREFAGISPARYRDARLDGALGISADRLGQ